MRVHTRRSFARSLFAGAIAVSSIRAGAFAQSVSADVTAPVQRLSDALIAAMKAGQQAPFQQRYRMLQPVVAQVFDLSVVLQLSVGPKWASLSADEQALLATAFERYTVANYVANFDSYAGQVFRISPEIRVVANGDRIVQTTLVAASGTTHVLSYVMRQSGAGWRAIDVLADGNISRVAVHRSDFRTVLAAGGGAALLANLERKTADLARGKLA